MKKDVIVWGQPKKEEAPIVLFGSVAEIEQILQCFLIPEDYCVVRGRPTVFKNKERLETLFHGFDIQVPQEVQEVGPDIPVMVECYKGKRTVATIGGSPFEKLAARLSKRFEVFKVFSTPGEALRSLCAKVSPEERSRIIKALAESSRHRLAERKTETAYRPTIRFNGVLYAGMEMSRRDTRGVAGLVSVWKEIYLQSAAGQQA